MEDIMDYEKLWNNLLEATKVDMDYQRGLQELHKKEAAYLAACESLSAEQREAVEEYISACEELGDCMTLLAYRLGKQTIEI
jgi:hypothetical protein